MARTSNSQSRALPDSIAARLSVTSESDRPPPRLTSSEHQNASEPVNDTRQVAAGAHEQGVSVMREELTGEEDSQSVSSGAHRDSDSLSSHVHSPSMASVNDTQNLLSETTLEMQRDANGSSSNGEDPTASDDPYPDMSAPVEAAAVVAWLRYMGA